MGVSLAWPRQANEVFAILPGSVHAALQAAGGHYYEWHARCLAPLPPHHVAARLVASFATSLAEIEHFLRVVRENLPPAA
jgi:threonine aldolase